MSYVDGLDSNKLDPELDIGYGYQGTPMALDIAAVQHLYGANMSHRTGNDVYQLPKVNRRGTFYSCIWDGGGVDEISHAQGRGACTINLNEATLAKKKAGGFISSVLGVYGGFTIANGVVIENAVGGNKNDKIIGNNADNLLNGGLGADTLRGGAGDDTYIVDRPRDEVRELVGQGVDTIQSFSSYILPANVENLALKGAATIKGKGNILQNTIIGNGADNILSGGANSDTLIGGGGADLFNYGNLTHSLLSNPDRIQDFDATDTGDLFLLAFAPRSFAELGTVPTLDAPGISSLLTNSTFPSEGVVTFTLGNRTFVALNDGLSGYQRNYDAIVEITGFKGTIDISDFMS
jgi:serralysin